MPGLPLYQQERQNDAKSRQIIHRHVWKTYENQIFPQEWRNLPEVPSKAEICPSSRTTADIDDINNAQDRNPVGYQSDSLYDPNLPHNIVEGPWPSKEAYLAAHHQILREDAIAPLRRAVAEFKKCPSLVDDSEICVYKDVTLVGVKMSKMGVTFRVSFAPQKQIGWKQSKRLLQGTIVALSKDSFKTDCKIAIVIGRGLDILNQNPPSIELFWGDSEDAVIDNVDKYVMVEAREGYFEASRHVLVAMQKMMTEKFELQNHIVHLDRKIKAPRYLEDQPLMDLSCLEQEDVLSALHDGDRYIIVDVLRDFPKDIQCGMDKSQMAACERMLTSRVAIIQGPPGTGKTFTSVSTLKVMIQNWHPGDPPIVVSAQTNHALDQLLNHVLAFEPNILRLGGRSNKANKEILKRTLYSLRKDNEIPGSRIGFRHCAIQLCTCKANIMAALETLTTENLLNGETLMKNGLITECQYKSLHASSNWDGAGSSNDIAEWLTEDQIMPVPDTAPFNLGLEVEHADIEEEEVENIENEFKTDAVDEATEVEEEDKDGLVGDLLLFTRKYTGRHSNPPTLSKIKQKLASWKNLYDVPLAQRGELYRFFEKAMNKLVLKVLKARLKEYQEAVNTWNVTRHMSNVRLIRHLGIKVIGCTTTGLSKYRSLLSAVEPRTLLIEEAAETLEGNVIGGLMDSIQHLILVGDHQQLQANCTVRALELAPYNMNISMFERLVNNSMGYVMLNIQRRMIQDVRKLLCRDPNPFYDELRDHSSVLDRVHNRPPVPGMGGRDIYFFSHGWQDAMNAESSRYNLQEAQFIARFFLYLCQNGVDGRKISVLTFYNGQKATLLHLLNKIPDLKEFKPFKVFTVDSYQGEENDIVLLSLVRGNSSNSIGFLDSKNRLVVALSRARRGLYLFGNPVTLMAAETTEEYVGREPLWSSLINYMVDHRRADVDGGLPVFCEKHDKITRLYEDIDFDQVYAGGCSVKCGGTLLCGHPCEYSCHPCGHESVRCKQACPRTLTCGHKCSKNCSEKCYCEGCGLWDGQSRVPDYATEDAGSNTAWGNSPTKSPVKSLASGASAEKHAALVLPFRTAPGQLTGEALQSVNHENPQPTRLSTPSKARTDSVRPRGGTFSSQTSIFRQASFGRSNFSPDEVSLRAWKNWDAKKADEELAEQQRYEEAAAPKADRSQLVFNETYIPTSLNDLGERVVASGPHHRTVERSNLEIDSLDTVIRHAVAGADGYTLNRMKESDGRRDDRFTSPTEVQANKVKARAASKTLIDVTNDMSNLPKKGSLLPAFGDEPKFFARCKPAGQRAKNKLPNRGGLSRAARIGRARQLMAASPASPPSSSRRKSNCSNNDVLPAVQPSNDFGAFRGLSSSVEGDHGSEGEAARDRSISRGRGPHRGFPSSQGATFSGDNGPVRGNNYSMRGRGSARDFPGRPARSDGQLQQPQALQPQKPAMGDLLGLDNSPASNARSPVAGDLIDLYSPSHSRSGAQRNAPAWGADPKTPERNPRPALPAPRTPENNNVFEERLINFD